MSWVTKILFRGGVTTTFPALVRKINRETMWKSFHKDVLNIEDRTEGNGNNVTGSNCRKVRRKRIGRTLFLKLVNMFIRGQTDKRNFVDYMADTLVKDNFETVRKIFDTHAVNRIERRELFHRIAYIKESLKYFYITHIGKDKDAIYDIDFGLHQIVGDSQKSECTKCLKPFQFLRDVK